MKKANDERDAEARLDNIKAQLDVMTEQRDALAAWSHEAMRELTALQQVTHGLAHGGDMCWDYSRDAKAVIDREPATSLSRRDARVKAEAFSQAVALCVELRKGQESLEAKYLEIDAEGEQMVVRDGINYANKALGISHCIDRLEGCADQYRQQGEGEA